MRNPILRSKKKQQHSDANRETKSCQKLRCLLFSISIPSQQHLYHPKQYNHKPQVYKDRLEAASHGLSARILPGRPQNGCFGERQDFNSPE